MCVFGVAFSFIYGYCWLRFHWSLASQPIVRARKNWMQNWMFPWTNLPTFFGWFTFSLQRVFVCVSEWVCVSFASLRGEKTKMMCFYISVADVVLQSSVFYFQFFKFLLVARTRSYAYTHWFRLLNHQPVGRFQYKRVYFLCVCLCGVCQLLNECLKQVQKNDRQHSSVYQVRNEVKKPKLKWMTSLMHGRSISKWYIFDGAPFWTITYDYVLNGIKSVHPASNIERERVSSRFFLLLLHFSWTTKWKQWHKKPAYRRITSNIRSKMRRNLS